ncbi:Hypothetical protein CINCED_3A009126 [Cinara cedri]|uniref:Major facilitator superfamily (MFS) profile domain-containing protein n=1 Tax=Cinara cedri TaxID=506608 RepID=A0A5E4NE07_9HEMI|nr:Hypothetical protein CINCED_3A009126 [Cinara cedri]
MCKHVVSYQLLHYNGNDVRCEIPECEGTDPIKQIYDQEWLRFTTPYKEDTQLPCKCQRYVALSAPVNGTQCAASAFNINITEACFGRWVFEEPENTIGTEFGIMCEENKWKLSMVGTVNNFGQFIGIPISGIGADIFGRKFTLVFCAVTSAALSIIQSFSINYACFLVLELLSSIISSGIFSITFILAIEFILPDQRILYFSILESFVPFGLTLVSLIASLVKDWRVLLQILNIPGLLFISYFWLLEESMRWLEMKGKHDQVLNVLKNIATMNKKAMPEPPQNVQMKKLDGVDDTNDPKISSNNFKDMICSQAIFWRMIRCSLLWVIVTLIYYGLTINSIDIDGNKYLNFSLTSFIEIPSCLLYCIILDKMSRKMSLSCMFLLTGFTCVVFNIIPKEFHWIKLSFYLISKLTISVAFSIVYLMTAEIFPTQLRATMVSICSMFGRIGSMLAPQTTLLTQFFGGYIMMAVFSSASVLGAAIITTLPESKNIQLPDTIEEAEQIGNQTERGRENRDYKQTF